jgi:signal transduction histidine kinase
MVFLHPMKLFLKTWIGAGSSIRRQLFLAMAGGAIVALTAINAAWLPSAIQLIRNDEAELQRIAVLGLREQMRLFVQRSAETLSAEAALFYLPFQERDLSVLRGLSVQFLKREPSIEELSIIDAQGKERLRVSRRDTFSADDLRDFSGAPLFAEAISQRIAWGPVQIGKWSEPWLTFAVPLKSLNSAPVGVVQAVTNLRALWSWTRDFNLSRGGRAYVVDRAGRLIAADDPGLVIKGFSFRGRSMVRELTEATDSGPADFAAGAYVNEHRVPVMATALKLPGPDWIVAVEQPESLLYAPIREKVVFSIALLVLGVVVSFGFARAFSAHLALPILRLREVVSEFGKGRLDRRADVNANNEVGELAQAFNRMADDLKASYENLESIVAERTRELGALYRAMTPLASSCSLEQMQQAAIERLVAVTGADMGRICVRRENQGTLNCTARHGYPTQVCDGAMPPDSDPITDAVITRGEAVVLPEFAAPAETAGGLSSAPAMRSRAVLPLTIGQEIAGVIDLASAHRNHFKPDKRDHLMALAHQMSIAIANVELYQKLAVQATALERANKLQADFTAMIAHDLRSPLNTVLGARELMSEGVFGPVTDEQKKWLDKIGGIVGQLLALVNDFLDLSKIEAGRIELDLAETDAAELLGSVLDNFQVQAEEKEITLHKRIGPPLPRIRADRRRLEQVLTNLLSNALKFTPAGGTITIAARIHEAEPGRAKGTAQSAERCGQWPAGSGETRYLEPETSRFVEFSVSDTGVGIPADEVGGLFEKYRQTTSGKISAHKGTGLGLAICKMIVQAHGGKIWVESEEDKGATFRFTIPSVRVS